MKQILKLSDSLLTSLFNFCIFDTIQPTLMKPLTLLILQLFLCWKPHDAKKSELIRKNTVEKVMGTGSKYVYTSSEVTTETTEQ